MNRMLSYRSPTAGMAALVLAIAIGPAVARDVPIAADQVIAQDIVGAKAVATGDINGDGRLDIVAGGTELFIGGLVWYENVDRDPPAFERRNVSTNVGSVYAFDIQDIAVGDIDRDDDDDVIVASLSGIQAYYSNGDAFPIWTIDLFDASFSPKYALVLRDLDADGDLDVTTCTDDAGTVEWFRNDGGSPAVFTPLTVASESPGCRGVAVGDLDGDGDLDIASVAAAGAKVSVHLQSPGDPPVWSETVVASDSGGPRSVTLADLDADGRLDIATASELSDRVAWYENLGGAAFGPVRVIVADPDEPGVGLEGFADGPVRVIAGDVDVDGDVDLATASPLDDRIAWYDSDGGEEPTFTPRTVSADPDGPIVYGEGIDANGNPAIVVVGGIQEGPADGARGLAIADLDGDGDADLMSASEFDSKVSIHESRTCELVFPVQPPIAAETADGAASLQAVDLDGDGDLDVAVASSNEGTISWYRNGGELIPSFVETQISAVETGAQSVAAFDIDGDGDVDLVSAAPGANTVAWFRNGGGGTFERFVVNAATLSPRAVHAVDIDGDGDGDIVEASSAENSLVLWQNEGGDPPLFTRVPLTRKMPGAWTVSSADLDGDGDPDVLGAALGNGRVVVIRNNGEAVPRFEVAELLPGLPDAEGRYARAAMEITAADINGDGRLDPIVVSNHDDRVTWFENIPGSVPTFTAHNLSLDPDGPTEFSETYFPLSGNGQGRLNGPTGVAAGDLDRDGDTDLLVSSSLDNSVWWFENDGGTVEPRLFLRRIASDAQGVRAVAIGDLNRDGRPDAISGAFRADTVAWYLSANDDPCVAFDVDGDGRIDGVELSWVGRAFGESRPDGSGSTPWWSPVDYSSDARVDGSDLSVLGSSEVWGRSIFECAAVCVD